MSLYEAVFADGESGLPLIGSLGFKTVAEVGRYRSAWLEHGDDGEPRIAVYTRNGGGNRECWHADDPKWGDKGCGGEPYEVEVDETVELPYDRDNPQLPDGHTWLNVYIGSKRTAKTGRRVMETRYMCAEPQSARCACPGCIIQYRLPAHPLYLSDRDDDFDSTYATVYFRLGEQLIALFNERVPGWWDNVPNAVDPSARWQAAIAALEASLQGRRE